MKVARALAAVPLCLLALSPPSAAGEDLGGADLLAAVGADDECGAPGGGAEDRCALNAAQLRARAAVGGAHEGAADRGEDADANAATANETEGVWPFTSKPKYDAKCFGSAGAQFCSSQKSAGKCVCESGCLGADGSCYRQDNKIIMKEFTINNAEWPKYKMYVQRMAVFNQVKTTSYGSSYNMGQDKFNLYELPGTYKGKKAYLLASAKWPDWVLTFDNTGGTAVSLWGLYAQSLAKAHEPWELKNIMLVACNASSLGHPNAIMIKPSVPAGGYDMFAYIHKHSAFVYGYWYPERLLESQVMPSHPAVSKEPGPGGLWVTDPPPPQGLLPPC